MLRRGFIYTIQSQSALTAPTLVENDTDDTLLVTSSYDVSHLFVSVNDGAYTNLLNTPGYNFVTGKIDTGDRALASGYFKAKVESFDGFPESSVADSDAYTVSGIANHWSGKKWSALGTSITAYGDSYAPKLATLMSLTLTNLGVAAGSLSTSASAGPGAIYNQIVNIPSDADLVTLEVGINDFRTNATLGTSVDATTATFFGALNVSIDDIKSSRPAARIVFLTPYGNTDTNFAGTWNTPNNNGNTLLEFQNAIKTVATNKSIDVIDVADLSGIGTDQGDFYMSDGIHLNGIGGDKYSYFVYPLLRAIQPVSGFVFDSAYVTLSDLFSIGTGSVSINGSNEILATVGSGFTYGACMVQIAGKNAIEFEIYNSFTGFWAIFGHGPSGFRGGGDPVASLSFTTLAHFAIANGSLSSTGAPSPSGSAYTGATRWRMARVGTQLIVDAFSGSWYNLLNIDLATQTSANSAYYSTLALGFLVSTGHNQMKNVKAGIYVP